MENISGEETARLLRRFGTVRTVPKGTLLSGKEAYWLLGGICALTCVNESGSQYSFLYFHRNMLFGFVPVLGRYYRMNRLVDVFLGLYGQNRLLGHRTSSERLSL